MTPVAVGEYSRFDFRASGGIAKSNVDHVPENFQAFSIDIDVGIVAVRQIGQAN
jgi:hypothetical protein